ncbi:hypothetical protein BBO_08294 [Beauveria brongniartii RCEF 3172]|uniref:Uncharacterized protein n=1 Tax=Beauveria brongniartii RCEF 3172 TaxID=1081107 RepID=A0A166XS78_9HYPO|nr:hypothetical protein BBO_08294 [Beauveria brongniartii RCEF 3172]
MITKHTLIGAAGNRAVAKNFKIDIYKRTRTQSWAGSCLPRHDVVLTICDDDKYLLEANEFEAQKYNEEDRKSVNDARTMMKDIETQIGGEVNMQKLMKMVSEEACVGIWLNGDRVMLAKYGRAAGLFSTLDRKLTGANIWESVKYAKASEDESVNTPQAENFLK